MATQDKLKFKYLTSDDLVAILGLTIKRDKVNKLITFLTLLSAYTDNSQVNAIFIAPSASGKSYLPLEISTLFPLEDLIKLGNCSANAFYHEQGVYNKERNTMYVDLSRKIIIFLDQPKTALLERLRALLSHDEKEIQAKITDKNQKGGNRTKTVIIKGFPAVVFCTATLNLDEQEATRFFLLSPEINREKIREAIYEKIKKEANSNAYYQLLEDNPERKLLKERIRAIKEEYIEDIRIKNPELIERMFFQQVQALKPRHQRDIARIINLAKVFALLNYWFRERVDKSIIADDNDIKEAFKIWDEISESQELDLPPYVYNLYKDIILAVYEELNNKKVTRERLGVSKQDIMQKHFAVYGRFLPDWQLRQWILPMLETAGLITLHSHPIDKRKILIYPTSQLNIPQKENISEQGSGVNI